MAQPETTQSQCQVERHFSDSDALREIYVSQFDQRETSFHRVLGIMAHPQYRLSAYNYTHAVFD